ncbi:MAG: hypothetical protein QW609_01455 [Candidatus Aenigmatarchaeota archaeon]
MALSVVEAMIATSLILIFLILVFVLEEPKTEIDLKEIGLKALKSLDQNDELRKYALENDTESIKSKLRDLIPYQLNYEVFVCEETCSKIDFEGEKVRIDYILAGNFGKFKPLEIVLLVSK